MSKKLTKPVFKLEVKTPDGFKSQSSGECDEGTAFALYMLPIGGDKITEKGTAGEFQAARLAYLAAAAKYHAEVDSKSGGGA